MVESLAQGHQLSGRAEVRGGPSHRGREMEPSSAGGSLLMPEQTTQWVLEPPNWGQGCSPAHVIISG